MDRLRTKLKEIFDKDDYGQLFKSVIENLPNQNNKITVICKLENFQFMLKIYAPGKIICDSDRPNGLNSPYVESEILKILNKDFFDLTPCIPKLFYVHKMSDESVKKHIKTIEECIDRRDHLCPIWNAINENMLTGAPTFIMIEEGHINFYDYCCKASTHIDVWVIKTVVWMILYTLNLIKGKYPKFLHGDLFTRNIILYMDFEFIEKDRLGECYYLQLGDYYVPYVGIIPKLIDFELSILNDDIKAAYKLNGKQDDIMQLLYSIKSVFGSTNQITQFIDKISYPTPHDITYFEFSTIIDKEGGLKSIQELLDSPVFGYQKGGQMDESLIWGGW
jgi:hypothetical protein